MHQLKDRDCQSGSKKQGKLYIVYKKPIFYIKIYVYEK